MRWWAFGAGFVGLLGLQWLLQAGCGVARPQHRPQSSVERRVTVKRHAAVRGRVRRDEVKVCRAHPLMR